MSSNPPPQPGVTKPWWQSSTLVRNISVSLGILALVAPKIVQYLNDHGFTAEAIGGTVAVVAALVSNILDIIKRIKSPNQTPITPAVFPEAVSAIRDTEPVKLPGKDSD
jgi:hypothetical protein